MIKNQLLKNYISQQSYERGHSAGEDEVKAIAEGMEYDLQAVDNHIAALEAQIATLKLFIK